MRGVILAGGLGTRLRPLSLVINKATLPVYDKPVIYHIVEYFREAGITDIMVVTGKEFSGDLVNLLGSGSDLGVKCSYRIQDSANGIAGALSLCKDFVPAGENVVVMLGDNLLENGIKQQVSKYADGFEGAVVCVKEVPDPHRFGVATLEAGSNKVINIVEKPKQPETNLAVIGVYMYDSQVFDIIKGLTPSARGEYEITDVNRAYMQLGNLKCERVEGWWTDAGTIESLYEAGILMHDLRKRTRKE